MSDTINLSELDLFQLVINEVRTIRETRVDFEDVFWAGRTPLDPYEFIEHNHKPEDTLEVMLTNAPIRLGGE